MRTLNLFLFSFFFFTLSLLADDKSLIPKIYIDCNNCDLDFVRSEIKFVNYVIDRKVADVFIMITDETTGSNGQNYTVEFTGQEKFINKNDTLKFTSMQDDTEDIIRQKFVQCLKLGLIPYITNTPICENIKIIYDPGTEEESILDDPWDSWVFSISAYGNMNSQKNNDSYYTYGSISAKRVTEDWKFNTSIFADYQEQNFYSFDENDNIVSSATDSYFSRGQSLSSLLVKSIGDHWSAGISCDILSSTYSNYDYRISTYPAIEYNLFPYSESTSRELKFLYRVGYRYFKYNETTIYNYLAEGRFRQILEISMEIKRPWGNIETNITGSNYFFDLDKNRVDIYSEISLNILKGLSVNIYGGYSIIHDQLNLPRGEVNAEELLLQKQELSTEYTFWSSVGLSYTFGSIYNNVVNPRF
ncbi:MAG: hypothetical protein JXR69_02890 [Candidatus Delongbacteria bacterium]|nr:hypothetical protein [Candidatus Delongbacteria bacterium]